MKPVVYLDMDGVIADFDAGIVLLGFEPDPTFKNSAHGLIDEPGGFKDQMYKAIQGTHFFETLPVIPGAWQLYEVLEEYDPIFLTAAPKFGADDYLTAPHWLGAAYSKRRWLEDFFLPEVYRRMKRVPDPKVYRRMKDFGTHSIRLPDERFICTTSADKPKFMHRRHGSHQILIDDRTQNCSDWEAAGGQAVLFSNATQAVTDFQEIIGKVWM